MNTSPVMFYVNGENDVQFIYYEDGSYLEKVGDKTVEFRGHWRVVDGLVKISDHLEGCVWWVCMKETQQAYFRLVAEMVVT